MPIYDYNGNASYIGLCIKEREQNLYHDSYFYMIVWDEEKQEPKSIEFATTAAGCGRAFASRADATPEVMEKYNAHCRKIDRHIKARKLIEKRREWIKIARALELDCYLPVKQLFVHLNRDMSERLVKLLTTKLRSKFRISLRDQIVSWLTSADRKYDSPLSPRQWNFI